jgi:hypothetical protein
VEGDGFRWHDGSMPRKLFIVAREQRELYRSLSTALGNEPDVRVVYDRRSAGNRDRGHRLERRQQPDLTELLRSRGFAVIRLDEPERPGNVRWSA